MARRGLAQQEFVMEEEMPPPVRPRPQEFAQSPSQHYEEPPQPQQGYPQPQPQYQPPQPQYQPPQPQYQQPPQQAPEISATSTFHGEVTKGDICCECNNPIQTCPTCHVELKEAPKKKGSKAENANACLGVCINVCKLCTVICRCMMAMSGGDDE